MRTQRTEPSPVLITDSRERTPLTFRNLPTEPGTLYSGDYSIKGAEHLFSVERKTVADLVHSVTAERARFERELHRLRGYGFARLLIIGTEEDILLHRYHSQANPKAVLHSLYAFEIRYSVPAVFSPTPEAAALMVERWAWWFSREIVKQAANF